MGQIDGRFGSADGVGVGRVEHHQVEIARGGCGLAERLLEQLRGQAGTAHSQQQGVAEAVGDKVVGERLQPRRLVGHVVGNVEPAKAVGDLCRLGLPHGVVGGPDAADDGVAAQVVQPFVHSRLRLAQLGAHHRLAHVQRVALLDDGLHQCLEAVVRRGQVLGLQFGSDCFHINAQGGQGRQMGLGLVQAFAQRRRGDAVAQEGGQCGRGEGHHCALADELLDVVEGRMGEVARRGARPFGAQRLAASRCQLVPGRTTEQLPVARIEPSRQGHGRLAAQVGPPQRLQAGINGGVERGQRKGSYRCWRGAPDAVAGEVLLEARQVGGGRLLIVSN